MERCEIPAGLLGKYYAARHAHGHYLSFAITGRYQFSSLTIKNNVEFITLLKYALSYVIRRHPALNYGLVEKTKEKDAHFVRLRTIEWDDAFELQTSSALDAEQQDDVLTRTIGKGHEYHFSDQKHKPAWKVVVIHYDGIAVRDRGTFDVVFLSHHAIADGKSGVAFHKTLFQQLSQADTLHPWPSTWPFIVPDNTPKPSFIEDALPFPLGSRASKQEVRTSPTAPEVWTSIPPTTKDYSSQVKIFTVPQTELKAVLQICRELHITVTGLLQALIIAYLSKALPEAKAFRGVTPYSMRPFTKASENAIVNHVSFILTEWTEEILTLIRTCLSEDDEKDIYKKIATQLSTQLKTELEHIPTHGSPGILDIAQISDFDAFCEENMRKPRSTSFELSNVGVVTLGSNNPLRDDGVLLEKLVFTQCGMVCGPALGCSVVSLAGGPMVVSMHWQGGVLKESFVDGLKAFLVEKLGGMGGKEG
ncbi:alcohol acetyltransferase [Tricladium varicosporioides]|nr:alcohol acetyltransferase [Hymenoscyphus varicosporioides]